MPADAFRCLVTEQMAAGYSAAGDGEAARSGTVLRTYRLACATTGEYTQFHGGTVSLGLAAVVTAINRVTLVYEVEFSIRLMLIENNNVLIYTNPATDPYSNNNSFAMLGQNQATIDAVIGNANYDVGHVLTTDEGGVASVASVGSAGSKAQGVSGRSSPTGDALYIDVLLR